MLTLEEQTTKQTAHTPTFKERVPDGYLACRDCGQVMTMEQWVSTPCVAARREEG